jgi:hypothetical protein
VVPKAAAKAASPRLAAARAAAAASRESRATAVVIREDFLTPQELDEFGQFARSFTGWDDRGNGVWKGRYVHVGSLADSPIRDRLFAVRKRVRAEIERAFELTRPLYADTLQVVRWPEGAEQQPHADGQNPDGSPHPYPWRSYGSIIYLNDDFEGGQVYFPKLGLEPSIRPGTLAFFPGTLDYLHGVRKVTRGIRYTVASFWTFEAGRQDGYPI